ncbi:patellin-3-like [Forsythia ovata]|uniref:Patellin-3-like n=1 Tax=Forsythia ovata TaxID=205694 RepID=A0ABD1SQ80_9LAMI
MSIIYKCNKYYHSKECIVHDCYLGKALKRGKIGQVVAGIEEVVVTDVPKAKKPTENEVPPQLEAECEVEKAEKPAAEEVEGGVVEENKIIESSSFKEESNKVDDLIDPQKKA